MICTNGKCGKKFKTPLDLFNGIQACPYCKQQITDVREFKFTTSNEKLYNLSELYYLRYLSPNSYSTETQKTLSYSKTELLDNAIKICSVSAKEGNPLAVYKMGYYNEHYFETAKSESDKVRIAFDYYAELGYSQSKKVTTEKRVKGLTDDEFALLKRNSAIAMLGLISKYPSAFKGDKEYVSKYNIDFNLNKIKKLYGDISINDVVITKTATVNKGKSLNNILKSCFSKERAPLFGLFFVSFEDFKKAFASEGNDKRKQNYVKFLSKGFDVGYLECDEEGNVSHSESRYFTRLNEISLKQFVLDEENKDKYFYLYFFNSHGKHNYLSSGKMEKIKKELASNEYELVGRLIDFGLLEYLFFDDDIVYFKKASLSGVVEKLINYVCGGEY